VYNRGVAALDVRDYAQARKYFEAALGLNDEFPEAHNNLAYTLRMLSLDNAEASLQHYQRALGLAPKFAQALYYRAILFVQLGRAADAEKDRAALEALGTGEAKKFAGELAKVIKAGKPDKSQDALSVYGTIAQ
jgi:tetratricopeptide (TPR) repeat protein